MIQDDGVDELFDELYGEDDSESDEGGEHGTTSQTQRSFDDKSGKLSSESHIDSTYVEIPKDVNLEDFVVDWKVLHSGLVSIMMHKIKSCSSLLIATTRVSC